MTHASLLSTCVELQPFEPARDLTLVSEWLRRHHVSQWWGEPSNALRELRGRTAETATLIKLAGQPVGYLCWQAPSDSELQDAGLSDLPRGLIDVDIMIGELSAVGRGVGPEALRQLFRAFTDCGAKYWYFTRMLGNAA